MSVRVYSNARNYGVYEVKNGIIELNEAIDDNVYIGLDCYKNI